MSVDGGSPNSSQSQRSRPNYPHPILLEDGSSRNPEPAPSSLGPSNTGLMLSDYDPEQPFPHTDGPYTGSYAYVHPSTSAHPDAGSSIARAGSSQSSPTGQYPPHYFNTSSSSQRPQPQQIPSPPYNTSNFTPVLPRIPQSEYYQGVIPFVGTPHTHSIPIIQTASGSFVCEICSMTFTRAHDLRRHHNSKHSEIKCQCVCGRNFSRKDALLRHQRPDPITGYGGCDEAQASSETA